MLGPPASSSCCRPCRERRPALTRGSPRCSTWAQRRWSCSAHATRTARTLPPISKRPGSVVRLAILRFKQILDQGLPPLVAEWTDVENLLVQVLKRGQYADLEDGRSRRRHRAGPGHLPSTGRGRARADACLVARDNSTNVGSGRGNVKARIEQEKEARAELRRCGRGSGDRRAAAAPRQPGRRNRTRRYDDGGAKKPGVLAPAADRRGDGKLPDHDADGARDGGAGTSLLYNGAFKTGPVALRTWGSDGHWPSGSTRSGSGSGRTPTGRSAMLVFPTHRT